MKTTRATWTNRSVLKMADGRDPVDAVVEAARKAVLSAVDKGWAGPPFDPMQLAELRGLALAPRGDIRDARTIPSTASRFVIEFNPNRPPARIRYSIAHEIAHTLFPDCGESVRNRTHGVEANSDDWQLEALCNLAAGEILMPIGSLATEQQGNRVSIREVSELRAKFGVSTEAILIRLTNLSSMPCAMFVASRRENSVKSPYRLDYSISSSSWAYQLARGFRFPDGSPLDGCTAIGFTAAGTVHIPNIEKRVHIECIGIPPYPGAVFPRVAGFLSGPKALTSPKISYVAGDASQPRSEGEKLVVHVVSDATPNWGGTGFAVALRRKWPKAQEQFRTWSHASKRLALGDVHFAKVEQGIEVASIVGQHGYGQSERPRIRYSAIETGLRQVAERATALSASVHMPRIGCGQAGGSWMIVEELITASIVHAKIPITVYDLPQSSHIAPMQMSLTTT